MQAEIDATAVRLLLGTYDDHMRQGRLFWHNEMPDEAMAQRSLRRLAQRWPAGERHDRTFALYM